MRPAPILFAALLLAACGSAEKTVVATDDGKLVQTGENSYRVEGADGTMATGQLGEAAATAAADFTMPAHAPLYPGGKVVSTMAGSGPTGSGRMVVVETADSMDAIARFYDARIREAGAATQMQLDQADSVVRAIGSADGKSGTMISVSDGGDMRSITITVSDQG